MAKVYYQLGTLMGERILMEVEYRDEFEKERKLADMRAAIQSGEALPRYIAADPKPDAVLFELEYPKINIVSLEPITKESV